MTLPNAYAKITNLTIDAEGNAIATFSVQQTRESINNNKSIEEKILHCQIDKSLPIYEQIYNTAKNFIFKNWKDDIVE